MVALLVGLSACAGRASGLGGGSGEGTGTGEPPSTVGSDDGPAETSAGSSGVPESCGDGFVDPGEQCDDGNSVDADGCNVDCVTSGSEVWSTEIERAFSEVTFVSASADGAILLHTRRADDDFLKMTEALSAVDGSVLWATPRSDTEFSRANRAAEGFWSTIESEAGDLVLASRSDASGNVLSDFSFSDSSSQELGAWPLAVADDGSLLMRAEKFDVDDEWWRLASDGLLSWSATAPFDVQEVAIVDGEQTLAITSSGVVKFDRTDPVWTVLDLEPLEPRDIARAPNGAAVIAASHVENNNVTEVLTFDGTDGAALPGWQHAAAPQEQGSYVRTAAVDVDDDGNVVVAHDVWQEGDGPVGHVWVRIYLAKYDAEGQLLWSHTIRDAGEYDHVQLYDIVVAHDGGVVVVAEQISMSESGTRSVQVHKYAA